MNKKVLVIIIILAIVAVVFVFAPNPSNQDFDGYFTMDVPLGKHYSDVAYCRANGGLGCKCEYWEDNAGCDILDGDIVVYYYNNSLLTGQESDVFEHAINGLTTSYMFQLISRDGDLFILAGDGDMSGVPSYLAGKSNHDGSEAVFVGGRNLDDVKHYANTIKFK